jgi:hypothetical protein
MTKLLERAFAKAAQLSPEKQDEFAQFLLAELEDEEQWDEAFAKSQDALEKLAAEALNEHRAGSTRTLNPDEL